jgi:mannosyltransferase OCH1-like enzyme
MIEMIPKTIHYCWFSGEKKPVIITKCIDTWKNVLSDYEFFEWNLEKFNKDINPFVSQALSEKKWAFAADYFRLWVLFNYGGIYLDCDVIVNKSLDRFLNDDLFIGWEDVDVLAAHLIGSVQGHSFIKDCMSFYENIHFIKPDGSMFLVPMPAIITNIARSKFGLRRNYKMQTISNNILIYPADYFSINCNNQSNFTEHLFLGSWKENRDIHYYQLLLSKHHKYKNYTARIVYFLKRYLREKFIGVN